MRKPVPQATSSTGPGGKACTAAMSCSTSSARPVDYVLRASLSRASSCRTPARARRRGRSLSSAWWSLTPASLRLRSRSASSEPGQHGTSRSCIVGRDGLGRRPIRGNGAATRTGIRVRGRPRRARARQAAARRGLWHRQRGAARGAREARRWSASTPPLDYSGSPASALRAAGLRCRVRGRPRRGASLRRCVVRHRDLGLRGHLRRGSGRSNRRDAARRRARWPRPDRGMASGGPDHHDDERLRPRDRDGDEGSRAGAVSVARPRSHRRDRRSAQRRRILDHDIRFSGASPEAFFAEQDASHPLSIASRALLVNAGLHEGVKREAIAILEDGNETRRPSV